MARRTKPAKIEFVYCPRVMDAESMSKFIGAERLAGAYTTGLRPSTVNYTDRPPATSKGISDTPSTKKRRHLRAA